MVLEPINQGATPCSSASNHKRFESMNDPRKKGDQRGISHYALAKIKEEYLATVKRSTRPSYEANKGNWGQYSSQQAAARIDPKVADPKPISARPTMTVQKLTPMQMSKRRKKGLCYHCDENWSVGHKCKSMKLYLIEEVQEEEGECITIDEEEEAKLCEEEGEIILCALLCSSSPSTMRVVAIINGQKVVVLIDTNNIHNFIDNTLELSLKLQVDTSSNIGVRIANGHIIKTMGECKEMKCKMQGLHLKINLKLLGLGGYGIVLST